MFTTVIKVKVICVYHCDIGQGYVLLLILCGINQSFLCLRL